MTAAYALEYEWGKSHYANRRTRAAKHVRGCRAKTRVWPKVDPTCGGAFKCVKCGALVGWCQGGYEDSPRDEWCADCWAKDDREREARGIDYDDHLASLRRAARRTAKAIPTKGERT